MHAGTTVLCKLVGGHGPHTVALVADDLARTFGLSSIIGGQASERGGFDQDALPSVRRACQPALVCPASYPSDVASAALIA